MTDPIPVSLIHAYVTFNGRPITRFATEEEAKQFILAQRKQGQVGGQYAIDLLEEMECAKT